MPLSDASRPAHEQLLLSLKDQDYQQWRHHPITEAYLLFLGDQVEAFRTGAADKLESGKLSKDLDLLRGQILTLRELQTLSLGDIHSFYRQEDTEEVDGIKADQGTTR